MLRAYPLYNLSMYRSESTSQVFLILLQWLMCLHKQYGTLPRITLAYDNMCNLDRLRVSKQPLPLEPPLDQAWHNIEKVIDVFHFSNHISSACRTKYSPARVKEKNPDFNTQAGEQTFVWVGRFKHILCAMKKCNHLFFLHRMVLRRNNYTCKCYFRGKKPILPKI